MNYSELRTKILPVLGQLFPEIEIGVETISYEGNISAFFLTFASEQILAAQWEKISSAIAIYFQSKLESDFERWNIYLFYLVSTKVDRRLKYKIENDPISSRKIVIDLYSDQGHQEIIADHITNTNLTISGSSANENRSEFIKNNAITESLTLLSSKSKKKNNEVDYLEVLAEIEKRIKNEI